MINLPPTSVFTAVFAALVLTVSLQGQTDRSPIYLQGGLFGGLASYNASFTELPGIPNCCASFDGGTGIGFDLNLGVEFDTYTTLFNNTLRIGATIGYQMLPGTLSQDEVVGNIIDGDEVTDGVVGHTLELDYSMVTLRPYAAWPTPLRNLYLNTGLMFGIPMSSTVNQQQELKQPSDPRWTFENGQRTRNVVSAALPDASSFQAAIDLGARYDLRASDAVVISPAIRYQLALTDITTSTPWSINGFFGGVTVQYQLPTPKDAPPPPPPPPPPPVIVERIVEHSVELISEEQAKNGIVISGDTIHVAARSVLTSDTVYAAPPILFFEKNSTMPVIEENIASRYQRRVVKALSAYLKSNPNSTLTVIGSTSSDEESLLAKERISWVIAQLGIEKTRINSEQRRGSEVPHESLQAEMRRVEFKIDGRSSTIQVTGTRTEESVNTITMIALHEVSCSPGPCTSIIEAYAGNTRLPAEDNSGVIRLQIPRKVVSGSKHIPVSIRINLADTSGLSATAFDEAIVVVDDLSNTRESTRVSMTGAINSSDLVLGYFDFDQSAFSSVDQDVVASVLTAVRAGKRVVVLPSTDHFGEPDYNEALRQRRAQTAIKTLALPARSVEVDLESPVQTSDASLMQRVALRCVRVRIID